jgi:hypothetical protein
VTDGHLQVEVFLHTGTLALSPLAMFMQVFYIWISALLDVLLNSPNTSQVDCANLDITLSQPLNTSK